MKFIIPDLEEEVFACFEFYKSSTMKHCYKCPYINKCFNINIQQIQNNIISHCERNNEEKFSIRYKCKNCHCQGTYIITPGGFLCEDCGNLVSIPKTELRKILKKDYEEIDYSELHQKIDNLKTKYELLTKIKTSNQEENKIIKDMINNKKPKNIINFKNKKRNNQ